jgi:hypothetical protein
MAGMFYSLQEAAQKLNKTEKEIEALVQDGKLREFRDGPTLRLYKVDEVEALLSDTSVTAGQEAPAPEVAPIEIPEAEAPELEVPEAEAPELELGEEEAPEFEIPEEEVPELELGEAEVPELGLSEEEAPEFEIPEEEVPELELGEAEVPELGLGEEEAGEVEIPQAEAEELEPAFPEPEVAEPQIPAEQARVPEPPPVPEVPVPEDEAPVTAAPSERGADTEEIFLAPETGAPVMPSDLTDADTALTGEGVSVLGESDKDYEVTDDTMAETTGVLGATGTAPEASLEEIEGDVNLDSFGSGSGLLDLSLQADDTSLGGILDEIYTAEVEGPQEPPEAGTVEDVAAEADQMLAEEQLIAPQGGPEFAAVGRMAYMEAPPDQQSNILGALLILPAVMVLYTAIVTVGAMRGVVPSILPGSIQGMIWYVVIGACVVALGVVGASFMLGREASPGVKKEKKAKPKKPPKPPKAKKAKKGKKGKEAAAPPGDSLG